MTEATSAMGHLHDNNTDRFQIPKRITVCLAHYVALLVAGLTLFAFGANSNRFSELATHWPVQFSAAAITAFVVLLVARKQKMALLAGVAASANLAYVAPLYVPNQTVAPAGRVCKLVSANVHTSNHESAKLLGFIAQATPDVVLVMEVNDQWIAALEQLRSSYPHVIAHPRPDNFGIAVYSRHPFRSRSVKTFDESEIPTIVATIDFHGEPLTVVGTHPLPPIGRRRAEIGNRHLARLGEIVSRLPRPVVVLGDLNATSWSPRFRQLIRHGQVRDSRMGFGVQPTWPTEPWLLRIPIDHALVSNDLVVTQRYVGPDIGSDHLPIVVSVGTVKRD